MSSDLTSSCCILWVCLWALGCQDQAYSAKWLKPIVPTLPSHIHSRLTLVAFNVPYKACWAQELSHLLLHSETRGLSRFNMEKFLCRAVWSLSTLWESQLQTDGHLSSTMTHSGLNCPHKRTAWHSLMKSMTWVRSFRAIWLLCLEADIPGTTGPRISLLLTLILPGLAKVPARRVLPHSSRPRRTALAVAF